MMELLCLYCCQMLYYSTVECLTTWKNSMSNMVSESNLAEVKFMLLKRGRVGATPTAISVAQ